MGRTSDDEGEASTKTCDNADDRPLKKARYVWQIKGKYHLKKSDEDRNSLFVSESSNENEHSCSCIKYPDCECKLDVFEGSSETNGKKNANLSCNNDIKITNGILEESPSNVNILTNTIPFNKENVECGVKTCKISQNIHIDNTWQLRKWQARQVARCFVDNTINRVLEDMGFVPLPIDADDILDEDLPITESENDGGGLEDEAVMMAIHSHGLQRTDAAESDIGKHIESTLPMPSRLKSVNCSELWDYKNCEEEDIRYPGNSRLLFESCISSPDPRKLYKCCNTGLENEDLTCIGKQMCMDFVSCPSVHRNSCLANYDLLSKNNVDQNAPSVKKVSTTAMVVCSSDPFQKRVLNQQFNEPALEQLREEQRLDEKRSSFEHKDFLDKAVAVAIKKKGLSTLSCNDFR